MTAGDAITITVAPATTSDVVLSLFDSNNVALVNEQNSAAVGAPETITNFNISHPGIHSVQIKTVEGTETDYALIRTARESLQSTTTERARPKN